MVEPVVLFPVVEISAEEMVQVVVLSFAVIMLGGKLPVMVVVLPATVDELSYPGEAKIRSGRNDVMKQRMKKKTKKKEMITN